MLCGIGVRHVLEEGLPNSGSSERVRRRTDTTAQTYGEGVLCLVAAQLLAQGLRMLTGTGQGPWVW